MVAEDLGSNKSVPSDAIIAEIGCVLSSIVRSISIFVVTGLVGPTFLNLVTAPAFAEQTPASPSPELVLRSSFVAGGAGLTTELVHYTRSRMRSFELFAATYLVATATPASTSQTTPTEPWTSPAIWVAILGASITVIGWFVVRWREDRERAIERQMKYCERQIEEFYGPLFSLMHEIFAAEEVQENFIRAKSDGETTIRSYFQRNYFLPLHAEMIQILKAKLYLVEGADVPPSFAEYLTHACDDRGREELKMCPEKSFQWPKDFQQHLTAGLKAVMQEYDDVINQLETGQRKKRKL
jgi:hypothetical protein